MKMKSLVIISILVLGLAQSEANEPPAPTEMIKGDEKRVLVRWPDKLPTFVIKSLQESKAQEKPLLLDFSARWCGPCKLMDKKVFPDPRVARELENWVLLKIDKDKYPHLANSFSVSGLPTYFLVSEQGEIMGKSLGYQIAPDFAEWLVAARKRSKSRK